MAYVNHLLTFIESNPALAVGFNLILLLFSGIFAHLLCKFLLIKVVRKVFFGSHKQDVPLEKDRRIAEKLSNFIPVIIVYYVLQFMPVMSNKSPIIIISSLGAVAAVLMIVFQHTLLSLVANVQLSSNDVLQLGDWIEMPDKNLSGEVTDIALHTITIRNWDNTISRIPTKNFLTETYTNWQAMFSSGARRIMRSIAIDQHSVRFLDQEMLSSMLAIRGVNEPLTTLLDGRDPGGVADRWFVDNGLTNLTLFRHYLMHYLAERPDIIKEMYIVARTLKPSPSGIPLEIYCFTSSTLWKDYENTQSAIFEYITAVAGQFSLRLYQYPAGHDFWRLSQEHAARAGLPPSAEG